jgi:hypothetical protein
LPQKEVCQRIEEEDPDGTYREQINACRLENIRVIGGRETGIKDVLLEQGCMAVYEVCAFPCVWGTHSPDFIVLEKEDKNTGKTYTVTAPDGRLVLWDPHEFRNKKDENKYKRFYSLYRSKFEITIFTQNANRLQRELTMSGITVADRIVSAPNEMENAKLAKVRDITRKELNRLVLTEYRNEGSITQLKLIQCMKEAEELKKLRRN